MPAWFVLIFGIVLERKKLPEIGKVARNRKSCPQAAERLEDSLSGYTRLLADKFELDNNNQSDRKSSQHIVN